MSHHTFIDQSLLPHLCIFQYDEQAYLRLANNATTRHDFLTTKEANLTYHSIHKIDVDTMRAELDQFVTTLERSGLPTPAIALYQNKCQAQQRSIELLAAAKNSDDQTFHEKSIQLYGAPNHDIFWTIFTELHKDFETFITAAGPNYPLLQDVYRQWEAVYERFTIPAFTSLPQKPQFSGVYHEHNPEMDDANLVYEMFEAYLQAHGITGWNTNIAAPGVRNAFSVDQSTKTIHIPHSNDLWLRRNTLKKKAITGLLEHEIGIHIKRRENGENGRLALLGIGLDAYLRGEEGVASFAEELIVGSSKWSDEIAYFTTCAAMGTGSTPRNLTQMFDLLYICYILKFAKHQYDEDGFCEVDEIIIHATHSAWNRAVRMFRGTTGKTPGAVYTKDLVYVEGNYLIWQLADKDTPQIKPEWLIGKYDPCNEEHLKHLEALGLL